MISGIIMASGFSRRMQQEKLLIKIGEDPMVEAVIKAAKASGLGEVILVYRRPEVKLLADKHGIKAVYNPNAHLGQSEAMKSGIKAAKQETGAYLFMVGDQPFLKPEIIDRLIEVHREGKSLIVVPTYEGKNTSPVLFDASFKEALLRIEGDEGGRSIIAASKERTAFVAMDDIAILEDIDSMESYQRLVEAIDDNNHLKEF